MSETPRFDDNSLARHPKLMNTARAALAALVLSSSTAVAQNSPGVDSSRKSNIETKIATSGLPMSKFASPEIKAQQAGTELVERMRTIDTDLPQVYAELMNTYELRDKSQRNEDKAIYVAQIDALKLKLAKCQRILLGIPADSELTVQIESLQDTSGKRTLQTRISGDKLVGVTVTFTQGRGFPGEGKISGVESSLAGTHDPVADGLKNQIGNDFTHDTVKLIRDLVRSSSQ